MYMFVHIFLELSSNIDKLCYVRRERGISCGKETRKDTLVVSILYTY